MAESPRLVFGVIGDIQTMNVPCMAGVTSVGDVLRRYGATTVLVGDVKEWRLVDLPATGDFDLGAACRQAFAAKAQALDCVQRSGFRFVLCNTNELMAEDWTAFATRHSDELRPDSLFFYAQHRHPQRTVFGDFIDNQDGGVSTETLAAFPNAVAFSCGGYGPLTDERAIWHGGFTSVATSSFRRAALPGGRENTVAEGVRKTYRDDRQMPNLNDSPIRNRHGLVVSVFTDRIVFARVALKSGERLGADWTLPFDDPGALSFARRMEVLPVPAFGKGAKASVSFGRGKTLKGVETDQVRVSFPKAGPVRAYEYEVTVKCLRGGVEGIVSQRRVFSRGIVLPPEAEPKEVTCVFACDELYQDVPLLFEVRPMDSFGRKGGPIAAMRTVPAVKRGERG